MRDTIRNKIKLFFAFLCISQEYSQEKQMEDMK